MPTPVSWPTINGVTFNIPASGEINWASLSDYLIALAGAQATTTQKVGTRLATSTPVTIVSASDMVVEVDLTVPGPVSVVLPAGVQGQMFIIKDGKGDADVNNITISTTGADTVEGAPTLVLIAASVGVSLVYRSGNWSVVAASFSDGSGSAVYGAGVAAFLAVPSALNLRTAVTEDTGTGSLVFATSPTLVTPNLGVPSAVDLTNATGYPSAELVGTLPIAGGGTGETTADAALNALLPTQTGQGGKILTTDGASTAWASPGATTLMDGKIFVGNASDVAVDVDMTGDVTIDNTGVTAIGNLKITSAMVASGLDLNKLDLLTVDRVLISDGSGVISVSAVTTTEIGYVSGVTSAIQTQLDAKAAGSALTTHIADTAAHGATGAVVGTTNTQTLTNKTLTDPIMTSQASSPAYAAGKVWYDSTDNTLRYFNDSTTDSVNIGQEINVKVRNTSGSTITPGQVVRITGAVGGIPTVALAQANSLTNTRVYAVVTDSIANNTNGYATIHGLIKNLNLSAFADGDILFLSASVAGGLTATRPVSPNYAQPIGSVSSNNASTGRLIVDFSHRRTLGYGTANQILGMNSGGTEQEYKAVTGSGSVVLATSPVITTPDIDGGTASNTSRITVPKGTFAAITALTRKEGTLLYATDLDTFFADDGTNLTAVGSGSGSGSGEINVITNPSAATATTGTTGTTRVTTGSPLDPTTTTAFSIANAAAAESSTSGGYFTIATLPTSLRNRKLKLEFWFTTPATDVYRVSVYAGSTRLSLSSDSSGVTTLPANTTGRFAIAVDSTSASAYTVNITRTSGSTGACLITNVIFGPGDNVQGAAISSAQTWTPTLTGFGNAVPYLQYERVGSNFIGRGTIIIGASLPTTTLQFSLPAGLTADYSGFPKGATNSDSYQRVGYVSCFTGSGKSYFGAVQRNVAATTSFQISGSGATYGTNQDWAVTNAPVTWVAGDAIMINICVPIAEWAGNGTVNLGPGAQVEYAYNTSTADSSDTTSFGYGQGGSQFGSFTAARAKRVQFQYPIQPGDEITLEISADAGTTWIPIGQSGLIFSALTQNTTTYGAYIDLVSSTRVDAVFSTYRIPSGATFGAAGTTWAGIAGSATFLWRVKKSKAGTPVGFGKANSLESGLVNPRKGQFGLTATSTAAGWATIRAQGIYYQDQDGNHRLKFNVSGSFTSKTLTTDTLTLTGVVFKNVTNFEQPVTAFNNGSLPNTYAATVTNTANVQYGAASSTTATRANFSGDVELESRPSWA